MKENSRVNFHRYCAAPHLASIAMSELKHLLMLITQACIPSLISFLGESGRRAALSFRSVFALNRRQSRVWVCHTAPSVTSNGNSNGNGKNNDKLYNVTLYTHHISSGEEASWKFLTQKVENGFQWKLKQVLCWQNLRDPSGRRSALCLRTRFLC